MKVAICVSGENVHSTIWTNPWVEYCKKNGIGYVVLNGYDYDIIEKLKPFDVLLWHFNGYLFQDMLIARSVLFSAKNIGLKIFPDFSDAWHFDDKVSETYLLQSGEAPIPESYMFYSLESTINWANKLEKYPIVAKLKNGSGSHNVKLLKSKKEVIDYSKIMFKTGLNSSPNLLFKTTSNIKSVKSFNQLVSRAKRVPEFLRTFRNSGNFPKEKGYVFFQEFIPNDGYDLKVVVVGDKLSYIARSIRKGDFRASGGGSLFFDQTLMTKNIINTAFSVSDRLDFNCMGYDFVVDNRTGEGKIVEVSYGFSHEALLQAGGFFDREGNWHEEPLNAPEELLKNILKK
jgi:glutathione synthase/RimK-type ligase-like ATP-grasp enzyme